MLFGVPFLHDISVFFPLLLAVWIIKRFGGASGVGLISTAVVLFFRPTTILVLSFTLSAVLLDLMAFSIRHQVSFKPSNVAMVSGFTLVSAYVAGAVIGFAFMGGSAWWSLAIWGPLHAVGALLSLLVTYPVMAALYKTGMVTDLGPSGIQERNVRVSGPYNCSAELGLWA
jgi:hypothetical protein